MHKLMFGAIAAATIAMAVPANAQSIRFGDGRGGGPDVSVRVGPGSPGYRAHARERCRYITTHIQRPNGTTVTKRERRCR